ncbi:MAG: hypothetical protein M3Q03_12020 [Chloroflexota bacterium]|nr:hypothetical protein [Chloroflexota bacterium]
MKDDAERELTIHPFDSPMRKASQGEALAESGKVADIVEQIHAIALLYVLRMITRGSWGGVPGATSGSGYGP